MGARLRLLMLPITALVALAPVALLAQEPPAPPSSPAAPGAAATPASPAAAAAPAVKRAIEWKEFEYGCEGGAKLRVYLHNETAKVVYKDKVYLMKQTRSADGGRYSDGKVVWWSKGNGGFLQDDRKGLRTGQADERRSGARDGEWHSQLPIADGIAGQRDY